MFKKVFIIAEAGVNHNGDINIAKSLIDVAAKAGADAVKFQTWKDGELTGKYATKVSYLENTTPENECRSELSRRLCLSFNDFRILKEYAESAGIMFLSTPDGFDSLNFLVDELDIQIIKIGSTELNHLQFLKAVGGKNKPTVISTGLGTLNEVGKAISAYYNGGGAKLTVLQCTSEYPAPPEEVNLRAMNTIAKEFNVDVGFSDHSLGNEASLGAVAMGAKIIEKHFTLDRLMEGPDHAASLSPEELSCFVKSLRKLEKMLGSGKKEPSKSELNNIKGIRRSVVASCDIRKETVITREMLVCKRPGTGIDPENLDNVIGKKIIVDVKEDQPLIWEFFRTYGDV